VVVRVAMRMVRVKVVAVVAVFSRRNGHEHRQEYDRNCDEKCK
jgi:hypothetical protein